MDRSLRIILFLTIAIISFFMHLEHFPKDLMSVHVWRQTQTQSNIINFYEEDMNILNPRRNDRGNTDGIFRMEFPLMQWLVAFAYKLFGNHLIICRIIMFIIGLISILGIYKLLSTLFHNEVLSLIGAWAFNFSPCFYYYTINPIPDNLALCCSIWGITLFFSWLNTKKTSSLLGGGLLLSLGSLCKLPFLIYYIVPGTYFIIHFVRRGIYKNTLFQAMGIFIFSILPVIWYISVIPEWQGNVTVKGIFNNKESLLTLMDYLQHTLIVVLPEMLLNYGSLLFFLAGFFFLFRNKAYKSSKFPLIFSWGIAVILYYFFEINAIAKVHDYYFFPFFPLLFILVAYGAYHLLHSGISLLRYLTIALLLLLPLTCYLRMQIRWNTKSPGFNEDLLIYKKELREIVPKNSLVVAGNDTSHNIFFYYIDKKGWGYHDNKLTARQLKSMIDKGAEYLYNDSRSIEADSTIMSMVEEKILEKGSINVYKLKSIITLSME